MGSIADTAHCFKRASVHVRFQFIQSSCCYAYGTLVNLHFHRCTRDSGKKAGTKSNEIAVFVEQIVKCHFIRDSANAQVFDRQPVSSARA